MTFEPAAGQTILIDGVTYTFCEHPSAPGVPYGQEGRSASVYQLASPVGLRALKVFKNDFRIPALVEFSRNVAAYANLPGLEVCSRTILTFTKHPDLLRTYPDLLYAILMPWVTGKTWFEIVFSQQEFTRGQSRNLAGSLVRILLEMEEHSLAHCDLSGPNVIWNSLTGSASLVDIEGLYAPALNRPPKLLSGTSGYAHRTAGAGQWNGEADRFAGALLLAEILGWCDPQVRQNAWGESYFDQAELQQDSPRYRVLEASLRRTWGEKVASLFRQAWQSDTLARCPLFGDWILALAENALPVKDADEPVESVAEHSDSEPQADALMIKELMSAAYTAYMAGQFENSQRLYGQALQHCHYNSEIARTIQANLQNLQARIDQRSSNNSAPDLQFQSALQAIQNKQYAVARELLEAVLRVYPEYAWGGQSAQTLLMQVQHDLEKKKPDRRLIYGLGIAAVSGFVLVAALLINWLATGASPTPGGVSTPIPSAAVSAAPPTAQTSPSIPTPKPSLANTLLPTATTAPTSPRIASQSATLGAGSSQLSPIDGMAMIYIPAGEFQMGSNGVDNEKPIRKVNVDAFWMDQTEVTNKMFSKFVSESGYVTAYEHGGTGWVFDPKLKKWNEISGADWRHPQGPGSGVNGLDNHPVVQITEEDAGAYCVWAKRSLPTEAQWEKAARGTDGRVYPWGNNEPSGKLTNMADQSFDQSYGLPFTDGYRFSAPVGSFPQGASPYGILDMAGNVSEFTKDLLDGGFVIKGGSFVDAYTWSMTTSRRFGTKLGNHAIGFRCASSQIAIIPTPTSPAALGTTDPLQFLRFYYDTISAHACEQAWSLLTPKYKEYLKNDHTGYIDWCNGIAKVDFISQNVCPAGSSTNASVVLKITYVSVTGQTLAANPLKVDLVRSFVPDTWMIDDANYASTCG